MLMSMIVGMFMRSLVRGARVLFRFGQTQPSSFVFSSEKSPSRSGWEIQYTVLSLSRFEENGQTLGS